MSRIFLENGEAVPVTYLKVEPNIIVRVKTEEKDGYNAVVLGIGPRKWKTRKGKEHTKYKVQKEWQVDSLEGMYPGSEITVKIIPPQGIVTISGLSKGKGFQGVIKRHGFHSGPKTHGSHSHRRGGSIGMCAFPGRVFKGKKMPGHMGNEKVTLNKSKVIKVDSSNNILAVKGAVPGHKNGYLIIRKAKKKKVTPPPAGA